MTMQLSSLPTRPQGLISDDAGKSSRSVLWTLYLEQLFTSWCIRSSEYSIVLFLAAPFPGTLFYISLCGFVRSLAAVLLSSWVGELMDRADKMMAMRSAIACQRVSGALQCAIFLLLPLYKTSTITTNLLFFIVVLLACSEKLAAIANIVTLERDWIINISSRLNKPRQDLNAGMRRVDLITKLAAPFLVSFLDTYWHRTAVVFVLATNVVAVAIEFHITAKLYPAISRTVKHKELPLNLLTNPAMNGNTEPRIVPKINPRRPESAYLRFLASWKEYAHSSVFLPSFANALLYLTVLSFGGQMVTYLLSSGFSALTISYLRALSVLAEFVGTWAAPHLTRRIGSVRAGLWFLSWQASVIGIAIAMLYRSSNVEYTIGTCLVTAICLKRLALWGSDLCVQYIVQEGTPPASRARFSATEMACQSFFEVLSSGCTVVFARPDQFEYPIYISYTALLTSTICYASFVRKVRAGHSFHMKDRVKSPINM